MAFEGLKKALRVGRRKAEPQRDTVPFPQMQMGQRRPGNRAAYKATPRNLRFFSRTPYARRAINAVKAPIAALDWEIVARRGITETPELKRQIETATYCFENPNRDDSWRSMIEQVVEDVLHGAGAIETQMSGDPLRPLWLWPTDGLSIQVFPGWAGGADEARYAQSIGGPMTAGAKSIQLRDDELIYIRPNPTTSSPFGLGPLEVAFNSISRMLGVGEFAGNVTSNAKPSALLNLGEGVDSTTLAAFRAYWTAEVEGQGKMPILGMKGGGVEKLYADGDDGLYLKYQEFLKAEIAIAFDLSPQNLGVERDVNRSTGEVAEARDWDQAIAPRAAELASYLTRHALHRRLGFYQLELRFPGLKREDAKLDAEVFKLEYECNSITADEYRELRGRPPMEGPWGKMTYVDTQIALNAARGAGQVLDPELPKGRPLPKPQKD